MVSGQLEQSELEMLESHLAVCAECRQEFGDMAGVVAEITTIADKRNPVSGAPGLTERFIARARSEGIPLHSRRNEDAARILPVRTKFLAGMSIAAALLLAVGSVLVLVSRSGGRFTQTSKESTLRFHTAPISGELKAPQNDALLRDNAKLETQVESLQKDLAVLMARRDADQRALKIAEAEKGSLKSGLTGEQQQTTSLRQSIADRDAQVAELNKTLEKLQALKDSDALAFKVEETELSTLRDQVAKISLKLEESEHLSAVANQAKDLIVARRLHIVDVDDTDENGNQQKPFGRIFYTEGKKLVFYAYDLSDSRKLDAKINFYVWGGKEGLAKPVKSLGIFHSDDASARRWVLQFDDPNVLAQINCIFVTAESSKKAVTQPTGRQLLFASLGKTINHP
jgi:hypothetical protein